MKKNWKITGIILVLVLALTLGITALAEAPETQAEPPSVDATSSATVSASADPALQEAMDALSAARNSSKVTDLEAELKAYVEAGTLTQEQADLILKAYRDQDLPYISFLRFFLILHASFPFAVNCSNIALSGQVYHTSPGI